MSNILIVSDIHIHDYPSYNKVKDFRLHQNRVLAELIINSAKKNDCDTLFILGDITERSIYRPLILTEVKLFLDKLMNYFKVGYFILGQHDLDSKDDNHGFHDSYLSSIVPSNLYYSDKKILNIGNCIIAFSDWRNNIDLSFIPDKVDFLCSHATISYSDYDRFKSQHLDQRKFDLAILGDIHKKASKGKFISVGTPIQNKLGDQTESTAIVLDPYNKNWSYINIDPENKLLKFKYTSVQKKEGFTSDNWYLVYKPNIGKIDGQDTMNIPAWDEINELINKIIDSNGLSDIHGKILGSCVYDSEVDFNFIPVHLRLKNFRSIKDCDIYFEDGDKILISGENGNGKSSLLLGLYYALKENRSLKDFVKFDTDSCEAEIEFLYQSKMVKLLRGTKDYGLWISGERLTYNNKREFEDDVLRRFPFINYMDIFFFTSNKSEILGSMAPERKGEIISKFFKLDKIDSYNTAGSLKLNDLKSRIEGKLADKTTLEELIKFIEGKLNNIVIPTKTESDLLKEKNSLLELHKNYLEWRKYQELIYSYQCKIDNYNDFINDYRTKIMSYDINVLNTNKFNLEQLILSKQSSISEYSLRKSELKKLNDELMLTTREGSDYYIKLTNAKNNICPTCGELMNKEKSIIIIGQLQSKVDELLKKSEDLKSRILNTSFDQSELDNMNLELGNLSIKLSEVNSNIMDYNSSISSMEDYTNKLNLVKSEMSRIIEPTIKVESLPEDYNSRLEYINKDLMIWDSYNQSKSELNKKKSELNAIDAEILLFKDELSNLNKYVKLTSSTGDIYKEVMTRLSSEFSDNNIRYDVNVYKFRNKDHLDLDISYNVKGRWVKYQSLSSGQKTLCDIAFLSKIVTGMGLLVFDEFLKHLSRTNTDICLDIINKMNVRCIMIASHMVDVTTSFNKVLSLNLSDNGTTSIDIT